MTDTFIPAVEDGLFKYIFGRDGASETQLIGLLGAILDVPREEYAGLRIGDPHLLRRHRKAGLGIVDIRVTTRSGMILNVEMQTSGIRGMRERIIYYSDRLYVDQDIRLKGGASYAELKKTIGILIADYREIDDGACHHVFTMYDRRHGCELSDRKEVHIVELRKEPEAWDNPALGAWLRFFGAGSREEMEMVAKTDPGIAAAAAAHREYTLAKRLRLMHEARRKARLDWQARIGGAREEGREQGIEQGIERGMERGMAMGMTEGLAKGQMESRREIAGRMKRQNISIGLIASVTDLSAEEIAKL
ncbi:MAG: Rpn family recombination-promoting nuclease/putative transposase [Clostridiales Family XIII bacterium]|nr:Rpn family recombination-promoting nuclease/putative transposase [Clostridiales Family XIII bacterium]